MELRHLRYFVAVAEQENVSRAALKLHVSQPALSRQVRDLEEELGFSLLERGAKSVRVTEAGKVFLREARAVLDRAEEAVIKARRFADGGHLELHIGYAPSPTVRLLPRALRLFQTAHPGPRVKLHDMSSEEMLTGVRTGALQMAFVVQPRRARLRGLRFEEVMREGMCLAMSPQHRLARIKTIPLELAAREAFLVFSEKDYPEYFDYLDALFRPLKIRPRIAGEHDSASSLIAAIESGHCVALVPESFGCTTGPRLKVRPLSPAPPPLVVGGVWPKAGLAPEAEKFWQAAKEAASMMVAPAGVEVLKRQERKRF
jgi:LysR family transcriptional regulator, benzoate and cis,cis-muconate-responsive activator of ben and cat genes